MSEGRRCAVNRTAFGATCKKIAARIEKKRGERFPSVQVMLITVLLAAALVMKKPKGNHALYLLQANEHIHAALPQIICIHYIAAVSP
jgi:hypothetical protein